MDPILQVLLSWRFVMFGLAIAAVMFILRTILEYVVGLCHGNLANSKLWNDLLLPILPIFIGAGSAYLLRLFPYPGFTPDANGHILLGDRIIFGLVAGLLSTLMYRVIKALLYQKLVGYAQTLPGAPVIAPPPPPNTQISDPSLPSRGSL